MVIEFTELASLLEAERLIPVLRSQDAETLRDRAALCLDAGCGVLELTTTTPGWTDVLAELTRSGAVVGVGTVLTVDHARQAIGGGAEFLVAPAAVPDVRAMTGSTPLIEGGLSPTEIRDIGAPLVKLYPAASVGPAHVSAMRDVLPHVRLVPTGGITAESAPDWIAAGAIAVGIGGGVAALGRDGLQTLRARLN